MTLPRRDLERITDLLESQEWIFAKTMPENPHWYTLRRKWTRDRDFVKVVQFIRKYGVVERYPDPVKGARYTVLVIGGWEYWTMGWPVGQSILINRKAVHAKDSLE